MFSSSVFEDVVRKFLNNHFTPGSSQSVARKDNCLYFKLPYIGPFSVTTKRRIKKLVSTFYSDLDIKLVFTPFKINSWFGAKDPIPASFHVQAVVPVILAYIGEASQLVSFLGLNSLNFFGSRPHP